jgi:hypothetical protein
MAISLDDIGGISGIFSTTMDGMSVIQDFRDTEDKRNNNNIPSALFFSKCAKSCPR